MPTLLRKTVIPTRSGGAFSPGAQRKDSGKFSTQQSHRNAIPLFFLGIGATSYFPSPLAWPFRKVPFSNS